MEGSPSGSAPDHSAVAGGAADGEQRSQTASRAEQGGVTGDRFAPVPGAREGLSQTRQRPAQVPRHPAPSVEARPCPDLRGESLDGHVTMIRLGATQLVALLRLGLGQSSYLRCVL